MDDSQEPTTGKPLGVEIPNTVDLRSYTPVQSHFLKRLVGLLGKRQTLARDDVPTDDRRFRLLDKAIYSTYQECRRLGLGGIAKAHLSREKSGKTS